MIPWFIVNLVSAIARRFGRDTYVTATTGRIGADRIHLQPSVFGAPQARRLEQGYRGAGRVVIADEVDAYPCPRGPDLPGAGPRGGGAA